MSFLMKVVLVTYALGLSVIIIAINLIQDPILTRYAVVPIAVYSLYVAIVILFLTGYLMKAIRAIKKKLINDTDETA